jgi:hypothetical protein
LMRLWTRKRLNVLDVNCLPILVLSSFVTLLYSGLQDKHENYPIVR